MLTMTSVFEPTTRPPIDLAPYVIAGCVLAALVAIARGRCMCAEPVSDMQLARQQVSRLARDIDPTTCRPRSRDLERIDPWNQPVRVVCAPRHYLWVVSSGADRTLWSSDDVVSGASYGQKP